MCYAGIEQGTISSKRFLLKKKTTKYQHRESNKGFEGYSVNAYVRLNSTFFNL